tara:strand:- start:2730 stop:3626 length:897 start_codon:yes stop_codon:yes gene_type:complete
MQIAWVFPGQGSQKIGMAKDVIHLKDAIKKFDEASKIFDRDLYEICEHKAEDSDYINDLNNTKNTQIALFLVESILLDNLKDKGYYPNCLAGHSLGEITALYAGEVLSFKDCVALIKIRSELMSKAPKGSMAALIGFDRDQLNIAIKSYKDIFIANDNSSSQVVLSGKKESLNELSNQISCKRFMPLNVSGAFHSEFMSAPSKQFSDYLDNINFNKSILPIISNSNPSFSTNPVELKNRLKDQMCNGVRWRETMDLMNQSESLHIVEIGPSAVLSGLAKRHLKDIKITQVSSSEKINY